MGTNEHHLNCSVWKFSCLERRHRKNAKPDVLSELQEVPLHLHVTQRLGLNAAVITAERKGSNLSFRNVVEVFGTENICMRHESLFNE